MENRDRQARAKQVNKISMAKSVDPRIKSQKIK